MKRSYIFLLIGLALFIVLFVEKKAEAMDVTYDEAVERFNQYKTKVKNFEENPDEDKVIKLLLRSKELTKSYDSMIEHQTFGNKLFNVKPILTEQETKHVKKLNTSLEQYYQKVIDAVLKDEYNATNLAPFIKIAEKKGEYHSDGITIKYEPVGFYDILVDGTFRDSHSSIIKRNYYIFETDKGNYYWEKPNRSHMLSYGDDEATLSLDQKEYTIKGNIVHKGIGE